MSADWEEVARAVDGSCRFRGRIVRFERNKRHKKAKHPVLLAFNFGSQVGAFWLRTSRIGTEYLSGDLFGEHVTIYDKGNGVWGIHAKAQDEIEATQERRPPEWSSVLGVEPDADVDDIKSAFRRLALSAHPDTGGEHNQFIRLRAAYKSAMASRGVAV